MFNAVAHTDCLAGFAHLKENSVDSIVTDPPYEIGFMGKGWDNTGIAFNVEVWKEAYRVLKPGGFLLAFGGTKTYHRMACAIEDAGFEIRNSIMWVYGSGFPKSMDISKAIDKQAGAIREVVGTSKGAGKNPKGFKADGIHSSGGHLKPSYESTLSATPEAQEWEGWGTDLKPAYEPIVVARKPLEGTVASNVLKWGTGGINIDASRVAYQSEADRSSATPQGKCTAKSGALGGMVEYVGCNDYAPDTLNPVEDDRGICTSCFCQKIDHRPRTEFERPEQKGRFPANIIFDTEAGKMLDAQSGVSKSTGGRSNNALRSDQTIYGKGVDNTTSEDPGFGDTGGASRFFTCIDYEDIDLPTFYYCAKASKSDRGQGNTHPTVKPTKLIEYLVKLVTKQGGISLDPFNGSGTHSVACKRAGINSLGFDMVLEHCEIAQSRLA